MNLNIICCTENKLRFAWETRVLLTSLREFDYSDKARVLIYKSQESTHTEWITLEHDFPEAQFFYYDDKNIMKTARAFGYPPLCRLYCLQKHWEKFPHLQKEAIFYCDTDIVFTRKFDFTPYLEDNINYLSWTGNIERTDNYLWQPYLDSKLDKVNPLKIEKFKKLDIVSRLGHICGITRELITKNNEHTGGAQYLLKNITKQFWIDCFNTCCEIKMYLSDINQIYMQGTTAQERENNGFQSWCADMWCVLYNLWKTSETRCPKEFDFAWSTDKIERLNEVFILHNAGVTSDEKIAVANQRDGDGNRITLEGPLFFKGNPKYLVSTPQQDIEYLTGVYNNPINKQFSNNYYIKTILKSTKNEY